MDELKIYTVVCYSQAYGEPSSIVMITTDKQKAKDICKYFNTTHTEDGYVSYEVEEHYDYLAKYPELMGKQLWYVTKLRPSKMKLYNPPGLNNDNRSFMVRSVYSSEYMTGLKNLNNVTQVGHINDSGYNVYVIAKLPQEAIEKGKELINKFIIEKEGNNNDNT